MRVVKGFKEGEFKYINPFTTPPPETIGTPILASSRVGGQRRGWRIVSRGQVMFLRPEAPQEEAEVRIDGTTPAGMALVAQRFRLIAPDGSSLHLSLARSAGSSGHTTTLQIEPFTSQGETQARPGGYQSGRYFIWQGQAYAVYNAMTAAESNAASPQSSNLIVTKWINGRLTRLQLLGEATTNLIGARLGGYLPYLDGALKHKQVKQVILTIDPEIQSGAYFLLRNALTKIDGFDRIGRPRRGAVTVLDGETGGILALAGYPSYDADWADRRRVLVDRGAVAQNPALDVHMAGSTVKVLTVGLGYLLFGEAQADLLPRSNNVQAVQQAFQDAYGVALAAPLHGADADLSDEAKKRFEQVGGKKNVLPDCMTALREVFLISPTIKPDSPDAAKEPIISSNLRRFFDEEKLQQECYPVTSRWPIQDTDSMSQLRNHALGAEEARFTTLRLAAILGTAGMGKVLRPYLVEAITELDGTVEQAEKDAVRDIDAPLKDLTHHRAKMMAGITEALQKVLLPGGTGSFFIEAKDGKSEARRQYLALDDPDTIFSEARRGHSDYGKSGTADYGKPLKGEPKKLQDSLFVYRHGRYLIAVWLEQADRGGEGEHKAWDRHPAHKLTHRLVQLIEALEH
jgi:hypothetical protein